MNAYGKNTTILITIAVILLSFGVQPRTAQALSDYGTVGAAATQAASAASQAMQAVGNKATIALSYKEYALDTIATTMAKAILSDLTKQTVTWINSGFKDSNNPFVPANYNKWVGDEANKAGGLFLDDLTNGKFTQLCDFNGWNIGLSLPQAEPYEIKTKCSLSDFANKWTTLYDSAAAGDWSAWLTLSQPQHNPYGVILMSIEEKNRRASEGGAKQQTDLNLNKGFLSQQTCTTNTTSDTYINCQNTCYSDDAARRDAVGSGTEFTSVALQTCLEDCGKTGETCETTTPGEQINNQLTESLGSGWARLEAADELNEVLGALVSYALSKARDGLITRSNPSSGDSYSTTNSYSIFKTSYTPKSLAADLFKLKYSLYDYKILAYNSLFKPGSDGASCTTDVETCDPEAYKVYNAVYKQQKGNTTAYGVDCSPYATWSTEGVFNYDTASLKKYCGVLAYNSKIDINNIESDGIGKVTAAGFDVIQKSPPSIQPQGMALYWYRSIGMQRITTAFNDLVGAYTRAAIQTASTSTTPAEVRCQLMDQNLGYDDAKTLIMSLTNSYKDDLDDLDQFFGANSTYDNLRKLVKSASDDLTAYNTAVANNASTTEAQSGLDNIAESITSLKSRLPNLPEKITKRLDDMKHYNIGQSCPREFTDANGVKYGNETKCMIEAENLKNATADFSYTHDEIERIYGTDNMHCWTGNPLCDTYGGANAVTGTKADTCNGDIINQFTCGDGAASCIDVYLGGTDGSATGGTGGSGGGTNGGGGGGTGGSVTLATPVYWRNVTCYAGADAFPEYCGTQAASSNSSGTGGPTVMCTTGGSTPNPNTGENYYTVALCTTKALCDTYYSGNTDCYGDLYAQTKFGGNERAAIDALNLACWGQDSASMDDATFNATNHYGNNPSERYACLASQL